MEPDEQQLHPNLARIAAAYDSIIEETDAGRITPAKARSMIALLEARDDHGVRWSIDPDTGEFVRKTAFGDLEYDTPPAYGVLTHDAYTLSGSGQDPSDPNLRLDIAPIDAVLAPPSSMSGATQQAPAQFSSAPGALRSKHVPLAAKIAIFLAVAALLVGGGYGVWSALTSSDQPAPPAPTQPAKPSPTGKPENPAKKDSGKKDSGKKNSDSKNSDSKNSDNAG